MNTSVLQEKFNGKYKLTRQREIIFHTLNSYTDHHPSAEEVYEIVRGQHPEIGLATVYRTLELFIVLDIVQKLDFGDGRHRYELCGLRSLNHHHLICISCGKVVEMKELIPEKLDTVLDGMADFSNLNYQLYVYGYCKDCQSKRDNNAC